jgi:hypothetical protein
VDGIGVSPSLQPWAFYCSSWPVTNPIDPPWANALVALLPLLAYTLLYAARIYAGWYFAFVKHPVDPVLTPALQTGSRIDKWAFLKALRSKRPHLDFPPSVTASENRASKAKTLVAALKSDIVGATAKSRAFDRSLKADADLALAAAERESARAALADLERRFRGPINSKKNK